jgi:hypothetical protein
MVALGSVNHLKSKYEGEFYMRGKPLILMEKTEE